MTEKRFTYCTQCGRSHNRNGKPMYITQTKGQCTTCAYLDTPTARKRYGLPPHELHPDVWSKYRAATRKPKPRPGVAEANIARQKTVLTLLQRKKR